MKVHMCSPRGKQNILLTELISLACQIQYQYYSSESQMDYDGCRKEGSRYM